MMEGKSARRGRPAPKVVIEISRMCNMRCIHCASSAGTVRPSEIGIRRLLPLIDELHEMGVHDIVFSGGEPLLFRDWPLLAAKVRDYGINLGIVSNGTYVVEQAENIARHITAIAMSVDGLEEVHNYVRQSSDAFRDVMSAFKEMARRDVYRLATTAVSRINFHQLEEIYELLKEHEVLGWQVQLTFASGRMKEQQQQICEPRDLYRLVEFLVNVAQEKKIELRVADNIGYCTPSDELMRGYRWQGCHAGTSVMAIEADGNVKGCLCQVPEYIQGKKFVEGNINTRPVKDIWNDDALFAYNRNFDFSQVRGFCRTCKYLPVCKCGCTAFAYYVTGTKYDNPYCLYRVMCTQ
jgi:radical SAM protein with 4Fe4S-binding SPASM domain